MRIVYVSAQLMRPGEGSHTHVNSIVSEWRRLGHEVELCVPRYCEESPGRLRRYWAIRRLRANVLRITLQAHRSGDPFHVVYVRAHPFLNCLPRQVSAFTRVVGWEVNGAPGDAVKAWPSLRLWYGFRKLWHGSSGAQDADLTVAVSSHIADHLRESKGVEAAVVGNGADVQLFSPGNRATACKKFGLDPSRRYVCFIGAFAPWQGLDTIARAIELLSHASDLPRWGVVFAGYGRLLEDVRELTRRHSAVEYVGVIPHEEVPDLVRASTLGLVTQTNPGRSPLKLFEYLACGVPAVATLSSIPTELALEEAVTVVKDNHPEELAAAITHLLRSPEVASRMGEIGRSIVVGNHSWEAVARRLLSHLEGSRRQGEPGT